VVLNEKEAPAVPLPVVAIVRNGHTDLFSSLPQQIITHVFNYAAASPDDVTDTLSLISKQSRKDCLHESIVHKFVPTMYLSSRPTASATLLKNYCLMAAGEKANGSIMKSLRKNSASSAEVTTRTMLEKLRNRQLLVGNEKGRSHYERMKVTGVEEFGRMKLSEALTITKDLYFEGIVSLDLSTTPSAMFPYYYHPRVCWEHASFLKVLLSMLPCLQEIDLTNTVWDDDLHSTSFPCSDCLEKLTWTGIRDYHYLYSRTSDISLKQRIPNIRKIKDISIDDYTCYIKDDSLTLDDDDDLLFYDEFITSLWNFDQVSKKRRTIFSSLRSAKKLERLSILNLQLVYQGHVRVFPQEALIKFVRNTLPPSVGWLRSDLSKPNIGMLQLEYPNIKFVGSE